MPEFTPAGLKTLAVPALGALADWRDYKGRWGPDDGSKVVNIPGIPNPFGTSPEGPRVHGSYGNCDSGAHDWTDVKSGATPGSMTLGASTRWCRCPLRSVSEP